jgi:hypothetical protein
MISVCGNNLLEFLLRIELRCGADSEFRECRKTAPAEMRLQFVPELEETRAPSSNTLLPSKMFITLHI